MPDITLCVSENCPIRNDCYRNQAEPSDWQSFCDFYKDDEKDCDLFMKMYTKPSQPAEESMRG